MGRGATLLVAVFVTASPPPAFAESKRSPTSSAFVEGWDDFVLDGGRPSGAVELRVHLGGEGWNNLRQSPSGVDPERSTAARSEARLTGRLLPSLPIKTHVEAGQLRYTTRSAMTAYGAGVGFEGDRHTVSFSLRAEQRRPSNYISVGGNVTHDALLLRLRYGLRTSRVEAWAGADRARQRFEEPAAFRNGTVHGVQAGVAYLGLSRKVVPELVAGWSRNEVAGDSDLDMDQRRLQVALRYTPVRVVSLTARVESTQIGFSVARPEAVNFARRDRRRSASLQAQVRITRQAAWTVSFDRVESQSTRAAAVAFAGDSVTAALTIKLGSTSRPPNTPPPVPGSPGPRLVAETLLMPPPPARDEAAAVPAASAEVAPTPVGRLEAVTDTDLGGAMRIETRRRGEETETVIHGAGLLRYSTLDLRGPLRFVVDLVGVAAPASSNVAVDTPLVRAIRVAPFRTGPTRVARVVFDLKEPIVARVEREGDSLRVLLRPVLETATRDIPTACCASR
jgi:hypothetical protein